MVLPLDAAAPPLMVSPEVGPDGWQRWLFDDFRDGLKVDGVDPGGLWRRTFTTGVMTLNREHQGYVFPGQAGTMITRLEARPSLKIATLPQTHHDTIDQIMTETLAREEAGVELYRDLLKSIEGQSVVLEEYARQKIAEETMHVANIRMMLRKSPPQEAKQAAE